jgi:Flp pilus assembly protein TadD
MNKLIILSTALLLSVFASAQPDDAKNLQQTARSFMQTGDFNNAIIVLNRALQTDKNNLELLKDLLSKAGLYKIIRSSKADSRSR